MVRAALTVTLVLSLCTMALFTTVHYLRGL
jgi:hypothetical protein